MSSPQIPLTIGSLAEAASVNVETIRFYHRKGLLPLPERPPGGIRRYQQAHVDRVRFIKSAQRLGFALDEIAELLSLDDGAHCAEASALAVRKLSDVRTRMADLRRMESALDGLVKACRANAGDVCCPLIVALQDSPQSTS